MKKHSYQIMLVFVTSLLLPACEEVIDIDLNSSNPVLVAEGLIEEDTTAWMRLSYTTDYFDVEKSEKVEDATIIITDNLGNSDTMVHKADGLYSGLTIKGSADTEYTVKLVLEDVEYLASAFLLPPREIYDVEFEKNETPRPGADDNYSVSITFKDDPETHNHYMFKFRVSGETDTDRYYLVNDEYYSNSGVIEYSPFMANFELSDEVIVSLYSIDEDTYVYYSQLNDNLGGMMGSSTPFNAKSNFGGDVLGYFTAWSTVEYEAVVE